MDPARMFKESLTSRPELENSQGQKAKFRMNRRLLLLAQKGISPVFYKYTPQLLPRHLRSPHPLAIQLLVVMHVDRHLQQLAGEFERRRVVRDRAGAVAADVEAGP